MSIHLKNVFLMYVWNPFAMPALKCYLLYTTVYYWIDPENSLYLHNQPLPHPLCIFMKTSYSVTKKLFLLFKNTSPTCVCIMKQSYYFQFFYVCFCRNQVVFSFSCLLFSSPESKLRVSLESLIFSVMFTDIYIQL